MDEKGIPVYLRCPIIPGINNTAEHIQKLSEVAGGLKHVAEIDLLPLHHMGTSRYEKMGRKDLFAETQSPSEYKMEQYKKLLENAGFRVRIIG